MTTDRTTPDSLAAVNVALIETRDAIRCVGGDVLAIRGRLDALERRRLSPRSIAALTGIGVAVIGAVQALLVAWTTASATAQARRESGYVAAQVMTDTTDRDQRLVTEASKATATLIADMYERRMAERDVATARARSMRR
jgi:gas vesicle protein